MKPKEVTFWLVLRKTFWSLLIRRDKVGSLWFRTRPFLFFGFLLSLPIVFPLFYSSYMDYKILFPTTEKMIISEGNFSEAKINKIFYYQLITSSGNKIRFEHNFVTEQGTFYNDNTREWLSHPATVQWFMLPSGQGFIVDLWMNGKQYMNINQAHKHFDRLANTSVPLIMIIIWIGGCLLSAISEFMYVRKKLIEEKNGE